MYRVFVSSIQPWCLPDECQYAYKQKDWACKSCILLNLVYVVANPLEIFGRVSGQYLKNLLREDAHARDSGTLFMSSDIFHWKMAVFWPLTHNYLLKSSSLFPVEAEVSEIFIFRATDRRTSLVSADSTEWTQNENVNKHGGAHVTLTLRGRHSSHSCRRYPHVSEQETT